MENSSSLDEEISPGTRESVKAPWNIFRTYFCTKQENICLIPSMPEFRTFGLTSHVRCPKMKIRNPNPMPEKRRLGMRPLEALGGVLQWRSESRKENATKRATPDAPIFEKNPISACDIQLRVSIACNIWLKQTFLGVRPSDFPFYADSLFPHSSSTLPVGIALKAMPIPIFSSRRYHLLPSKLVGLVSWRILSMRIASITNSLYLNLPVHFTYSSFLTNLVIVLLLTLLVLCLKIIDLTTLQYSQTVLKLISILYLVTQISQLRNLQSYSSNTSIVKIAYY